MTDRELLELAAKAAGIEGWWESEYLSFINRANGTPWRPLDLNDEALSLAVRLRLNINFEEWDGVYFACAIPHNSHQGQDEVMDDYEDAATRRAIVRAAAEIGKATP